MSSLISDLTLLESQPLIIFWLRDFLPAEKMNRFPIRSGPPNKISLDLVDGFSDFVRDLDKLHHMRGGRGKSVLCKGDIPSMKSMLVFHPFIFLCMLLMMN